jgi:hypothetical protein
MVESDIQLGQTAQPSVIPPIQCIVKQSWPQKPAKKQIEGNLAFHTCQRRAETEMPRPTERQMAVVRPKQIKTVGIGESIWIAIRSCQNRYNPRTLLDGLSTKLHIIGCDSRSVLYRRLEAEQFFYSRGNNLGAGE